MEQDHQKGAQDSSDAADQYDQPAVADSHPCYGVGDEENHQPDYGIDDEILDGFEDQERPEDDHDK